MVNVGGNSAPDYRLSLQSSQLGPVTMQLNDGTNNLLSPTGATGQLAQYTVNGKQVQSDSDTVTLAPGVTVELTGSNPMASSTVTVAADPSGVGTALQSFVTAYNAAMSELNNNRGQTGGLVGPGHRLRSHQARHGGWRTTRSAAAGFRRSLHWA